MGVDGSSKLKKVKLPLRLIKLNTLRIYGRVEVHLHTFLNSELAVKQLLNFYPRGGISSIR
jgi:hypothetical protein